MYKDGEITRADFVKVGLKKLGKKFISLLQFLNDKTVDKILYFKFIMHT